jgi:HEAT repeat protein
VESGDTIGGLIGGTLVGILASRIPIPYFLYLWMAFLICAILVFVVTSHFRPSLPPLPFRIHQSEKREKTVDQIKLVFKGIQKFPFLKGLVVIVLFQWVFMNILEFQYTKAMEQSVTQKREPTIAAVNPNMFRAAVLSSPEGISNFPEVDPHVDKRVLSVHQQEALTEKLGLWKGIFSGGALIVQVLFASRIITALGIVGAMLLHPMVMLMSLVGMFLKFGFLSSVVSRLNFEITNVIHKNAYFASHYAFPKFLRDQAAEFLEGMVRPMGTIVGMLAILVFQFIFSGRDLSMWIHIVMAGIMFIILISTFRLQPKYTDITKDQLFSDLPYPEKLNAIEILSQRGHGASPIIFMEKLQASRTESPVIRMKLLAALGKFRDYQTLPEILEALRDPDSDVRLEAAHALMNFHDIGEQFYSQAFSRFRMIETLKEVFLSEKSATVRSAIIRVFSLMREPAIVTFLLDVLKDETSDMRPDCIYTLGLFRDPVIAYYVLPFLDSEDPRMVGNAIAALWQFPAYHGLLEEKLRGMLKNGESEHMKAGIYALGEIRLPWKRELFNFLNHEESGVSLEAAFALTKLAEPKGFTVLLNYFLTVPVDEFEHFRHFFHRLKPKAKHMVKQMLTQLIVEEIQSLGSHFDTATVEKLKRLYLLLDEHEELFALEEFVSHNQNVYGSPHA